MNRFARITLCAVTLPPLCVATAHAQQAAESAVLEFDHGSGVVRLIEPRKNDNGRSADTTSYGLSRAIQLPRPMNLKLRVVNTNTGLYQISTTTTATASPAIAPLATFLGKLGPYLPELGAAMAGAPKAMVSKSLGGKSFTATELAASPPPELSRAWELARKAEQSLMAVESRLYGAGGLQETLTQTLAALEEMRLGTAPDAAAARLRQAIAIPATGNCRPTAPSGVPSVQGVIGALRDLMRARQELDTGLGSMPLDIGELWTPARDSVAGVRSRVVNALGDLEPIVANAYRIEQLATLTANACAQQDVGDLPISRLSGRTVTVSIAPRDMPEIQRVANRAPQSVTITVVKKPFVRPSLGITLINIPSARFNVYGARSASPSGAEIYTSAIRDARFTWGASLGTTWKLLDFRESHNVAIWIPEFSISAQSDTKAFGVGGGVSIGPVKIGTGMMWVKRTELSGLRVGQILPNAQYLLTRESYGAPMAYWSLSLFGWPGITGK